MDRKDKTISIILDQETEQELRAAAALKGVAVEQYCYDAIGKELYREKSTPRFSDKDSIALSDEMLRYRAGSGDSGKLIQRARKAWRRDVESLDKLFAECDEITQGRRSSTDSADLVREAREERHRDMERNGSP